MIGLFWENFRISIGSIFANKTRSILTALGIVIGVLSVTLMGTLISGLDKTFEKLETLINYFFENDKHKVYFF